MANSTTDIMQKVHDIDAQLRDLNKNEDTAHTSIVAVSPVDNKKSIEWNAANVMMISSIFLIFSIVILALATYLLKIGKSTNSVLKIFGTILIITIACFLILVGYDDKQIAPVIGLLGTLAGYLLGKDSIQSLPSSPQGQTPAPPQSQTSPDPKP